MKDERRFVITVLEVAIATVSIIFLLIYGIFVDPIGAQAEMTSDKKTHDSLGISYTYNGEEVRWYVFTDPDTNVQYLFNDQGGVTPRLGID